MDTAAPAATIDAAPPSPSNDTGPSFAFSAGEASTFECSLDGGAYAACTSPHALSGLGEGSHTFAVSATDTAGNTGAADSHTWTVDTTAPSVTVGSGPADPTNGTGASFTFSSADGGTSFECALDAGGFAPCASPATYSGLAEGCAHIPRPRHRRGRQHRHRLGLRVDGRH